MTYRSITIEVKLRLIIMLTVVAALILACASILTYDQLAFRSSMQRDLAILAETVGSNSTAAITFGDQKAAADLLAGLKAMLEQNVVLNLVADHYPDVRKPQ